MIPATHNEQPYADKALELMHTYGLQPMPENYAVWFTYTAAKNPELAREIDNLIHNGLVSQDTCSYLYNKYLVAGHQQKAVDDAAVRAQKVLLEVLKIINDFGGETQSYNKDVDQYMGHLTEELGDDAGVRDIVKELIEATSKLKKSGEKINEKLEESKKEINTLKKDLQQVTIESQRDFLTGVFNRKTFEKFVDEQMLLARENHTELCLLMIDIDHFKQFNDKFGHLLGDEVLKIVARTLMDVLKGRDVVARFGGEEFIVILPETPMPGAHRVAEMIRTSIASKELKRKDTGETYGTITVSIGAARYHGDPDSLPSLIKRADDGLYQAKRSGRNQVICEQV